MRKKRKIDFILDEDDDSKLIFRFYPKKSICYSFNDAPPTSWEEVYKVYYSYAIFRSYQDDTNIDMLFNCECDEDSIIKEVAARIELIVKGESEFKGINSIGEKYTIKLLDNEIFSFGCGVSWVINKNKNLDYKVTLWNYDDTGFRFNINKNKLKEFGIYLNRCCESMLKHEYSF